MESEITTSVFTVLPTLFLQPVTLSKSLCSPIMAPQTPGALLAGMFRQAAHRDRRERPRTAASEQIMVPLCLSLSPPDACLPVTLSSGRATAAPAPKIHTCQTSGCRLNRLPRRLPVRPSSKNFHTCGWLSFICMSLFASQFICAPTFTRAPTVVNSEWAACNHAAQYNSSDSP